jgi:hypothetical protein
MKKFTTLTLGALSLVALASACNADVGDAQEELGTSEEAVTACTNDQATFAVMASMAAAAAKDMKRWLPGRDLQWNSSTWKLELSQYGRARCPVVGYDSAGAPIKECKAFNCWLSLQNDTAQGMQFGGQALDVGVLRNRMYSYWQRQTTCLSRPDNGFGDDCPAERHDLVMSGTVPSNTCAGGVDIWYHAYYGDTTMNLSATDAAQLKNQLLWAGGTDNPFLAFDSSAGNVKLDPFDAPPGGGSGTGGTSGSASALAAPNPVWKTVGGVTAWYCDAVTPTSMGYESVNTDVACTCNGINRLWKPKPLSNGFFVCKP